MNRYPLKALESELEKKHMPICIDSRKVEKGCVFVALPGSSVDGGLFIPDAVSRGAAYVVCRQNEVEYCGSAIPIVVDDPRYTLGKLARIFYDTGNLSMPIIGVTGTNGKTTITYLLEYLFRTKGNRTGVIGTIAYRWPGFSKEAPLTTPQCLDLHAMLAQMQVDKTEIVFMEVSSHALDQRRIAGISFKGVIFTNLTQDHLDYHKDMKEYFHAKARLFFEYPSKNKVMVASMDSQWGRKLAKLVPEIIGFGFKNKPTQVSNYLFGKILSSSRAGLHLQMSFKDKVWELCTPLVGAHNAENLLAVQAISLQLGLTPEDFYCFEKFTGVPGRLERIVNKKQLDIFVDYAHTPDALINVLSALRNVGFKRIITVFGCGGNRDKAKRPLMGKAVAKLSDVAVLTSDNPRNEDPELIMADVLPGLKKAKQIITEPDREKAIRQALELLSPGDALLVAGKGHECTQQIGFMKYPFSDQSVIRKILGCD